MCCAASLAGDSQLSSHILQGCCKSSKQMSLCRQLMSASMPHCCTSHLHHTQLLQAAHLHWLVSIPAEKLHHNTRHMV